MKDVAKAAGVSTATVAATLSGASHVSPELKARVTTAIADAYRVCRELLELPLPPTAIFIANNFMLIGVMQALAEAGISVPGQMPVAGIDDFPWAPAFQPALTVVRQPIARMASAALARLVMRMNGDSAARSGMFWYPS